MVKRCCPSRPEEHVPAVAFRNEFVSEHHQARLGEPLPVGRHVGVAPPHRGLAPEPAVVGPGPLVPARRQEEESVLDEPTRDRTKERRLCRERHVDHRVERNHGLERPGWQSQGGGIGTTERGAGDQVPGPLDLYVADIDTGHPVTGRDQVAGNRHAAATAEVEETARAFSAASSSAIHAPYLPGLASSARYHNDRAS